METTISPSKNIEPLRVGANYYSMQDISKAVHEYSASTYQPFVSRTTYKMLVNGSFLFVCTHGYFHSKQITTGIIFPLAYRNFLALLICRD